MKTKNYFLSVMLLLSILGFVSCGSDDDENSATITDEELLGTWTVIDGYETNGETTYTGNVGKTAIFYADGTANVAGENIKWSRSGNRFSFYYEYSPQIVFSGTFSYSNGVLLLKGAGNGWTFEYKAQKTGKQLENTLVGTWKCSSSTTTFHGATYTDYLKNTLLTVNADGTFTSTSSDIGKSGTWKQTNDTITLSSTDGGIVTLSFSLNYNTLTVQGNNSKGETFECVFIRQ